MRNCGHATRGDQDVRSSKLLPVDFHRGLRAICEGGVAADDFYVGLQEEHSRQPICETSKANERKIPSREQW